MKFPQHAFVGHSAETDGYDARVEPLVANSSTHSVHMLLPVVSGLLAVLLPKVRFSVGDEEYCGSSRFESGGSELLLILGDKFGKMLPYRGEIGDPAFREIWHEEALLIESGQFQNRLRPVCELYDGEMHLLSNILVITELRDYFACGREQPSPRRYLTAPILGELMIVHGR